MQPPKDYWQRFRAFVGHDIWDIDPRKLSRVRLFFLHQAQLVSLVTRDFMANRCMLRASALTYTTLLSIVPLLALMFSVLKGFGVQNALEPLILERIAVGSEEIVDTIISYINNTNVGRLGTVGLIALIISVLALLSNIEESFNHIWGVKETRTLMRRFSDYFSVVILGPVFLLAAISMTATLQTQGFVQHLMGMAYIGQVLLLLFKVLPYVAMWAAFTFLYVFMPNIKVRLPAALLGGIAGGTLWQLGQWGYVYFQVGVARYNAIYGTMAALPIFMVWIYVSWLIVLLGLEVTYAAQNLKTVRQEYLGGDVNFATRERIALTVLVVLGKVFQRGDPPWTRQRIGEELELPPRLVRNILADLVRLGLLSQVQGAQDDAYQPGRSPETLRVLEVLRALRHDGVNYEQVRSGPAGEVVREVEERLAASQEEIAGGLTLGDLLRKPEAGHCGTNEGTPEDQ